MEDEDDSGMSTDGDLVFCATSSQEIGPAALDQMLVILTGLKMSREKKVARRRRIRRHYLRLFTGKFF